jgi:hypothetical protein
MMLPFIRAGRVLGALALLLLAAPPANGAQLLVEAESLATPGGWKLDTQFIHEMGSPYLLAHGLGRPVGDASDTIDLPEAGAYHVYVRTKDWVERWGAVGDPGRFRVAVNGTVLEEVFGDEGAEWHWEYGGTVALSSTTATIALQDMTGFDGRVDALYFTTDKDDVPPDSDKILDDWRMDRLGLPADPEVVGGYDLVVIGGGYAGMGSALSAARMGIKVALIQNRAVLGGNGSSEVRVWAKGNIRRGKFPRIGEIIAEIADSATKSPGRAEEFGDEHKEAVVRAEENIDLFLNHHAYAVEMDGNRIASVLAFDTRTSARKEFRGSLFADCTGHGTIGAIAGADCDMTESGRMGMSNMWRWAEAAEPVPFPETPWALNLEMDDFPYPREFHAEWFWESGYDQDPLGDAEGIRDWNLRAAYGAFNAMKNRGGAADHAKAYLEWIAYIGGPRESRRLMGDVVLTEDDIVAKREFPDGCVPSTWSIDLHYPKEQYMKKFPDNPFISYAVHDRRVDRLYGYPVPYRCFYSRNIENLFMAGRDISVTHEALGTVRVMQTLGMVGEVVGKAASICIEHDTLPRGVYEAHLPQLLSMLDLPGKARRATLQDEIVIPEDALARASALGPYLGVDPTALSGIVVDDMDAQKTGEWTESTTLAGFVAYGYLYGSGNATLTYSATVEQPGNYRVLHAHQPHENRASNARVIVHSADGDVPVNVNMKVAPTGDNGFQPLGVFRFEAGKQAVVTVEASGADGAVHTDAVQLVRTVQP